MRMIIVFILVQDVYLDTMAKVCVRSCLFFLLSPCFVFGWCLRVCVLPLWFVCRVRRQGDYELYAWLSHFYNSVVCVLCAYCSLASYARVCFRMACWSFYPVCMLRGVVAPTYALLIRCVCVCFTLDFDNPLVH